MNSRKRHLKWDKESNKCLNHKNHCTKIACRKHMHEDIKTYSESAPFIQNFTSSGQISA